MSTPEEKISALVKYRAGLKAYITACMNNLNALDVDDLKIHFKARKGTILNCERSVFIFALVFLTFCVEAP